MVDIHCHILPQIDDGPTSLDETLAMARFCVTDGITHIIATPHCHRYIHLLRETIVPLVNELNSQLFEAHIPLTILPGSEIQVTNTEEYRREYEAGVFCHLGDTSTYTLLEFNWDHGLFPPDAPELVRWLRDRGTLPIIAHPERYNYFVHDAMLLQSLVDAGAWIQVTVDSLLGHHGPDPKTNGDALLEKYSDAVLATDAHNMIRCSGLSKGYQWVKDRFGQERCDNLYSRADKILKACEAQIVVQTSAE